MGARCRSRADEGRTPPKGHGAMRGCPAHGAAPGRRTVLELPVAPSLQPSRDRQHAVRAARLPGDAEPALHKAEASEGTRYGEIGRTHPEKIRAQRINNS